MLWFLCLDFDYDWILIDFNGECCVWINCFMNLFVGCLMSLVSVLCCFILLFLRSIMLLFKKFVLLILWVMINIVLLSDIRMLCNFFCKLVWINGLSVFIGLLRSKRLGFKNSVCISVICCFCFLESFLGKCCVKVVGNWISLDNLWYCCLICLSF